MCVCVCHRNQRYIALTPMANDRHMAICSAERAPHIASHAIMATPAETISGSNQYTQRE